LKQRQVYIITIKASKGHKFQEDFLSFYLTMIIFIHHVLS